MYAVRPVPVRRCLWLLWAVFVLRGFFYCAVQPLWEGWDEPFHYAYLEHLSSTGTMPRPGVDPPSREVSESLRIGPLPWTIRSHAEAQLSYEQFWQLPPAERDARMKRRADLPAAWRREPDRASPPNYQSQHPPLYYATLLAPLRLLDGATLPARVFWLRLVSILIASVSLPLAFGAARRLLGSDWAALASVACAVAMPINVLNVARVGNDSLSMTLFAALILLTLRMRERPLSLARHLAAGAVLGAGLLTKAYFLTAIPVYLFAAVLAAWKAPAWRRVLLYSLAALALALLIAGWWYLYIQQATGTFTGQIQTVDVRGVTPAERIAAVFRMNWFRVADVVLTSYVWFGGSSYLQVRSWMYHLFGAVFVAAIALLLFRIRRWTPAVWIAVAFFTCFCLSIAYHALTAFLATGYNITNGWYLHALSFLETALLGLGLGVVWQARRSLALLATLFAALDLYGLHFHLWPYYNGYTAHRLAGGVTSFKLAQLNTIRADDLAERLAVHQPYLHGAGILVALWALYLLATIGLVVFAWRVAFRREA